MVFYHCDLLCRIINPSRQPRSRERVGYPEGGKKRRKGRIFTYPVAETVQNRIVCENEDMKAPGFRESGSKDTNSIILVNDLSNTLKLVSRTRCDRPFFRDLDLTYSLTTGNRRPRAILDSLAGLCHKRYRVVDRDF
jgi:hypothetical protein